MLSLRINCEYPGCWVILPENRSRTLVDLFKVHCVPWLGQDLFDARIVQRLYGLYQSSV